LSWRKGGRLLNRGNTASRGCVPTWTCSSRKALRKKRASAEKRPLGNRFELGVKGHQREKKNVYVPEGEEKRPEGLCRAPVSERLLNCRGSVGGVCLVDRQVFAEGGNQGKKSLPAQEGEPVHFCPPTNSKSGPWGPTPKEPA